MSLGSVSQRKPYLLLEYFPNSARWHDCHIKEAGSNPIISLGNKASVPCKFCVQEEKPLVVDEVFAKYIGQAQAPSSDLKIEMKGRRVSFNHVHDFMINEGVIWSRRQLSRDPWTPIYFDGFPEGMRPSMLHADGANLVVIDERGYIHYKKVLREHRRTDLVKALAVQDNWPIKAPYIAVNKATKINWKAAWFTLPVLSGLVNLLEGKKIQIPSDCLAWGVSHRGTYNQFYKDDEGIEHPVNTGVTTLYVLLNSGKDIRKLDPWSPPKAYMNILVTDTPEATFRAFNMSPSASTLMLIGYESKRDTLGGTIKTLKVKTRLIDIDTEGLNPGIKYTYFKERTEGEAVRVISKGEWQEHALPDDPLLMMTGVISIFQTGEGNQAREMRLEAYGPENKLGYYHKRIDEASWTFKPYHTPFGPQRDLIPLEIKSDEPFQTTVHNWIAEAVNLPGRVPLPQRIEMHHFGKYSENSTLFFYYPEGVVEQLVLRRRKTLLNFLGARNQAYDLINCAGDIKNAKLEKLFPAFDERQERVFVDAIESQVIIRGFKFCVVFKKVEPNAFSNGGT
jgi:hypothetical protein